MPEVGHLVIYFMFYKQRIETFLYRGLQLQLHSFKQHRGQNVKTFTYHLIFSDFQLLPIIKASWKLKRSINVNLVHLLQNSKLLVQLGVYQLCRKLAVMTPNILLYNTTSMLLNCNQPKCNLSAHACELLKIQQMELWSRHLRQLNVLLVVLL